MQSRKRLKNVEHKLRNNDTLKKEYIEIVENQLKEGIVERIPSEPSGTRIIYMPYKPVIRENVTTTKVREWYLMPVQSQHHQQTASMIACTKGLYCNQICGTLWSELE